MFGEIHKRAHGQRFPAKLQTRFPSHPLWSIHLQCSSCKIKDTDAASDTYNKTFTSEGVTILDVSDPYQVVIESSAGQFFKNNTGSTVLTARVYRDGTEIDAAGTSLTYTWTMNNKDGGSVTTIGGVTFPKTGKTLTVTHDMVDIKGTFFCSIA